MVSAPARGGVPRNLQVRRQHGVGGVVSLGHVAYHVQHGQRGRDLDHKVEGDVERHLGEVEWRWKRQGRQGEARAHRHIVHVREADTTQKEKAQVSGATKKLKKNKKNKKTAHEQDPTRTVEQEPKWSTVFVHTTFVTPRTKKHTVQKMVTMKMSEAMRRWTLLFQWRWANMRYTRYPYTRNAEQEMNATTARYLQRAQKKKTKTTTTTSQQPRCKLPSSDRQVWAHRCNSKGWGRVTDSGSSWMNM